MSDRKREAMVREQLEDRGIRHSRVLAAFRKVPRHGFVPKADRWKAYEDTPLPIGLDQTISQPYIVGLMTEALDPQPEESILEIGTGSGYQTAILCELYRHVYSIERHPELADRARRILADQGYKNVTVQTGDGTLGWPQKAPFNAILIAAAGPRVPYPLMNQLCPDQGKLILPLETDGEQELVMMVRTPESIRRVPLGPVRFVPLIGRHGWPAS